MNRELIKKLAYNVTKPLSFSFLKNASKQGFIFPFYHLISENIPSHTKYLYPGITPEQFKSDVEFLLKYFQPASVSDLKEFVATGKKSEKPLFFLSFDDGLKACYDVVFPILKEKGIPAAFFINPGFVDNKALFYRFKSGLIVDQVLNVVTELQLKQLAEYFTLSSFNTSICSDKILGLEYSETNKLDEIAQILDIDFNAFLNAEKPYMSASEISTLRSEGFLIGAHSIDHPLFSELEEKEQIAQIQKSINFIKENYNPEISAFAFPFTDFGVSDEVFKYIDNSKDIDISFGTAGIKNDDCKKHIQRIPMEDFGIKGSEKILRTEYAYYMFKSVFGKNKISR